MGKISKDIMTKFSKYYNKKKIAIIDNCKLCNYPIPDYYVTKNRLRSLETHQVCLKGDKEHVNYYLENSDNNLAIESYTELRVIKKKPSRHLALGLLLSFLLPILMFFIIIPYFLGGILFLLIPNLGILSIAINLILILSFLVPLLITLSSRKYAFYRLIKKTISKSSFKQLKHKTKGEKLPVMKDKELRKEEEMRKKEQKKKEERLRKEEEMRKKEQKKKEERFRKEEEMRKREQKRKVEGIIEPIIQAEAKKVEEIESTISLRSVDSLMENEKEGDKKAKPLIVLKHKLGQTKAISKLSSGAKEKKTLVSKTSIPKTRYSHKFRILGGILSITSVGLIIVNFLISNAMTIAILSITGFTGSFLMFFKQIKNKYDK